MASNCFRHGAEELPVAVAGPRLGGFAARLEVLRRALHGVGDVSGVQRMGGGLCRRVRQLFRRSQSQSPPPHLQRAQELSLSCQKPRHARCHAARVNETREMQQEARSNQDAGLPSPVHLRRTNEPDAVVKRDGAVRAARRGLEQNAGTARSEGGSDDAQVQPKTVVVIDDELDLVELTVLLLQSSGHRAIGSTDGSKAVAMVTGEDAEVVVLDFMLAGMTGGDVCEALRAEPRTREVRIVLLSGTPEDVIRRSCTQYDTYLRKPANSTALFEAIKRQ